MTRPFQKNTAERETILVVDDEPSVRSLIRVALGLAGFHVLDADCGTKGLRVVETYPGTIHILLTDLTMPDINGIQLAAQVARMRPEIKVIYSSGRCEDDVFADDAIPNNASFLQKPFALDELNETVRELLDRTDEFSKVERMAR